MKIVNKRPRAYTLFILAGFLIISFIVYFNSLSNPFHFDDEYSVSGNTHVRDVSNISEVFVKPKILVKHGWRAGHYRPIVFISFALNYYFGGKNTWGYHLVNLAFHMGSAVMVFLIVKRMLTGEREALQENTGFLPALASGLIFLVHPFNSEVVNYITARSSVMCTFFYLLAFWFWIRFRRNQWYKMEAGEHPGTVGGTYILYLASLLTFLLAMLTKEIAITLPVILWLYDFYFVPVKEKTQHLRRLLAYVPFVLSVLIPYLILRILYFGFILDKFQRDIVTQLSTQMPVLVKYLKLFIFPVGLSVDHDSRIYDSFFNIPVIGAYVLLMTLIALAVYLYMQKNTVYRVISLFIIWFFITLMPTTIIPLNAIFQENRGYIAGVSFAVLAGILIGHSLRRVIGIRYTTVILCLIIIIFSAGTISRNAVWKDDLTLWSDALAKGSNSIITYTYLSKAYISRGEFEKGEDLLTGITNKYPNDFFIHYNLSWIYYKTGRLELALEEAGTALKIFPSSDAACFRLGLIHFAMGNIEQSSRYYNMALNFNPEYPEAHYNLGVIHEMDGLFDLAKYHYGQVINNKKTDPELVSASVRRLKDIASKSSRYQK